MKIETECKDGIGIVRLNDPATLNALDLAMVEAIGMALDTLSDSRCIVLTGAGKAFSSGANLQGGGNAGAAADDLDMGSTLESHINPLMTRLRDLPVPWISSVRGAAAGVGCALALAADLIVASEESYFLQAFARIGLIPDGGSTFLLARAAGRVRAMEMILLGDRIPATRALDWGLINRVVPDDALEDETMTLATRLAAGPTKSLGYARRVAWTGAEAGWEESLAAERKLQREAGQTADFAEGVTAFLQKRPAAFTGN